MVVKRRSPPSGIGLIDQAGITLIELVIAIALSSVVVLLALSLFKDVGFAARFAGGRRDAAFEAQAAFESLTANLMTGGGILRLTESEAVVLNRSRHRIAYAWGDSLLKINGAPCKFALASLRIEPSGPVRPAWQAFEGEMPWELDSLDGNHDGRIDFAELDRDECRFIAALRVTMVVDYHGAPISLTALVHPRNRASASDTGASESASVTVPDAVPEP